jgi:hypothetical protein
MAGDGFPINNRDKTWTNSVSYKKWLRKVRRTKKIKRSSQEDLCSVKGGICKGDLGIPRSLMPQFTLRRKPFSRKLLNDFRRYIKNKYGIKSRRVMKAASELNPSQNEISRHRVEGLIEDNIIDKQEVPLLISKNDYIVDGHHRWAAFRVKAPNKKMETVVVDAPIKDILGIAIDWGAEHQMF